jgi:hypothetical protein
MWQPKKLFEVRAQVSSNVNVVEAGPTALASEKDYYYDLLVGRPLPDEIEINFVEGGRPKRFGKDFVPLGDRLIAHNGVDCRMKALLLTHCHTIELVAPFARYTYFLPQTILEAVDVDETVAQYNNETPRRLIRVFNLVLLDSATRDAPIFKLYPPEYSDRNFVNEDFVALYQACNCKGLKFVQVEVSPWWEAFM